ncbi:MAG: HPr family phosphocarrier protein [Pasteurellaceae bacterium]|nr:HPr family phosphocarrier protein [Pasteurellaceae bacterium]
MQNPHGLHARPTAKVIETLSPFQSQIWLEKNGTYADAKRYNALIQLGVRQHDVIHFYLSGADAKLALQAVQTLAEGHFGESIEHTHGSTQIVQGIAVRAETSEGQAVTFRQQFTLAQFPTEPLGDLAEKQQQLQHAIRITQQQLAELVALPELNDSFSGLFQAHQMLLDELADELLGELSQQSVGEACWQLFETMKQSYQCLDDPYLQARTLDLDDLRHRLLHNVYGLPIQQPELSKNAILIADELYPSTLAQLLTQRFQGICLQQGNRFSHTALLAQSANIPLLIECGESLKQFALGDKVQVDWLRGEIFLLCS